MISGTNANIVFFGTEDFSLAALRALVENGYRVAAVVTKPDSARGRGMRLSQPAVKKYAIKHDIPVWQPERLEDIENDIAATAYRVGVLSAYGKIIPDSILDLFDTGITNIHPSLLPAYRGPSPIETAVMNGDQQTGVSLIRLVSAMDAGPVYAQKTVPLDDSVTASALYETLGRTGAAFLVEFLPSIINGSLVPQEQTGEASYTKLLRKADALVNPRVQSAIVIDRHVRAYALYPRTKMVFGAVEAIIMRAHVASSAEDGLIVDCADDTQLAIDEVIAPSGRRMAGLSFKNGYLK